uniref:Fidgetin-like protein 1 n=1 Tax=Periophthalmus magnuspinnatus TaxID=409849 RepID=A0A3B4BD04_9GOBI
MSNPHLDEWQRRSFDISSGTSTPQQTADSFRAHIFDIQYAWASHQLTQAAQTRLLRTYTECYAAVLDSDDPKNGLNNYAESALHLARSQKNHSEKWESGLSLEGLLKMPCVQKMVQAKSKVKEKTIKPEDENITVGQDGQSLSFPVRAENAGFTSTTQQYTMPKQASSTSMIASSSSTLEQTKSFAGNSNTRHTSHPVFGNPSSAQNSFSGHPNYHTPTFSNQNTQPTLPNSSKRKNFYNSEAGETSRGQYGGHTSAPKPGRNFKTAREQLIVDQQKKYSNPQQQRGQTPGLAAAMKKSLGANRPRGTFSKFVSPLPRQEDEQNTSANNNMNQDGTILDERLKNFEPKIIELIMSEIMDHGPPITWDDIAGLEFAKTTIKEIVVWPMLRPDIFTGLRGPPKGILLFGPPGTGKTLIGKCIACQSGATFFSISASSLTSKWVGEGEKMVRALFAIARCHQPAVIFIDEIDSLLSQRSDSEHESSRRIKTEFLVQLDGATTAADDRILVVGATNRPQEIDEAARRRLAKRLYIPLPEGGARRQIVTNLMSRERNNLRESELDSIVEATESFSGADMTQLCREAALGPIRSIQFSDIATISADQVRPITYADFQEALKTVRPSVSSKDLELYEDWNKTFGCGR